MLGGFSLVVFLNDLLQSCSESLHLTKMKVLCLLLRRKSHLSGWNVKGVQIFDGRYTKEELFLSKIRGWTLGWSLPGCINLCRVAARGFPQVNNA